MSSPHRPPFWRRLFTRLVLSTFRVPRDAIRFGFRRFGERTALLHGARQYTFGALEERVGRLVSALQRRSLGRGALVFAALDDGPELLELRYAALELGLVVAGVAPWTPVAGLEPYKQLGAPQFLFLDERLPDEFKQALRALAGCEAVETGPEWEALLALGPPTKSREKVLPSDVAGMGFTSGTTGVPKVLTMPQAAMLKSLTLTAMNVRTPVGRHEVMLSAIPLNGAGSGLLLPLALTGATLVIPTSREPGALLELLKARAVTRAFLTPSQLLDLLDDERFTPAFLPALRNIIYGTAPMPVPRLEEALARMGPLFQQGYGMAEVLPPVSLLQMEQHLDAGGRPASRELLRSAGWVVPQVQVRVVDAQSRDVAAGEVGEILVRSPTVFQGYWRLEGVDRSVFHEGYLRTGDWGTLRADGLLTILDRRGDRLTFEGQTFSARLLEEAVYDEATVKEACLVQRAENERPTLFVSPRRGARVEPDSLKARLRATGVAIDAVRVLGALPRSPLQKLLRREVRALLAPSP